MILHDPNNDCHITELGLFMQSAYLGLDYELFFGPQTGTVERCLIEPTDAVTRLIERFDGRLILFVDVGFIVALKEHLNKFPSLDRTLYQIQKQLQQLVSQGHDVQLHIHPHWLDSRFDGQRWCINTQRYRLHDFSAEQVREIVVHYRNTLSEIVGDSVFAYRAGGWCIQPFAYIQDALKAADIWLDSTVYADGLSEDTQRGFDFRGAPRGKPWWRFEHDPLIEDRHGSFVELPISAYKATPQLFWKMAFTQKLAKNLLKPFGDGQSMRADKKYYLNRLVKSSVSVLSIDGMKSDFTLNAIRSGRVSQDHLNIMGHPKSLSRYSLNKFAELLEFGQGKFRFSSFQELQSLRPD